MPDNVQNPGDRSDRPSDPHLDGDPDPHAIQNAEGAASSSAGHSMSDEHVDSVGERADVSWEEVEAMLSDPADPSESLPAPGGTRDEEASSNATIPDSSISANALPDGHSEYADGYPSTRYAASPPLALVETAFLASTASLLWLISYYLSIGPWMRILFPIPIALVHLRWGNRAAWMASIVSGLLLSVLMGPYLSILFLVPYGLLGVQLGFLWQKKSGWGTSIAIGTIVATLSLFFRLWLLSAFLGEDLWIYLTGRITDLLEWAAGILVNWGILGVGMLGQPHLQVVQLATVGMVLFSDLIYLFTVHLAAWLLLERVGTPISTPPKWVQVLLDEAQ